MIDCTKPAVRWSCTPPSAPNPAVEPRNQEAAGPGDAYVPSFCRAPRVSSLASSGQKTSLSAAIEGVIAKNPGLKTAQWGLVVADENDQTLYQHDADNLFNPASNLKLVTAATALSVLGQDSRFRTRMATDGEVDGDGTLHGNLYLVGGGDPSLTTSNLAAGVAKLGLSRIEGNIVVDDGVFDATRLGPGWAWDDTSADYSAEIDGLTVDENVARLHVTSSGVSANPNVGYLTIHNATRAGSNTDLNVDRALGTNVVTVSGTVADAADVAVTVHDPALYAGNIVKWLCHEQGIEVTGAVQRGTVPPQSHEVWNNSSATLIGLERHMLKESDNLYAESLFRALASGQSAAAADKEKKTLHIDEPCRIVDGSGLSRDDLVSPALLLKTVQQYYRDGGPRDCLPVAGVDGTLKYRMPSLKGRVQAKTGTLGGVSTLAGWLTLKDGRNISFAWMCNDYVGDKSVKGTEDSLLEAIDGALG